MRTGIFHLGFWISLFIVMNGCGSNSNEKASTPAPKEKKDSVAYQAYPKTILFFGNSLTAGYGVDPSDAFPALIQKKLDSLHIEYKVINAGVSGETSSGGLARVDWILHHPPEIFVLELGANDGLRGIPLSETRKNLQTIIQKVKEKNPQTKIVVAGMMMPPNMGQQYTREFQNIYPSLAKENQVSLIPFLLQDVGGEPLLNQADGIHPNTAGHRIVAENVWRVLKDII